MRPPKREARRRRSVEEKRRIVEETLEAGAPGTQLRSADGDVKARFFLLSGAFSSCCKKSAVCWRANAATLRDLDQLDSEALKALIRALHEQVDLEVAHKSPVAAEALQRIAALYAIEKEIRGRPPDQRRD